MTGSTPPSLSIFFKVIGHIILTNFLNGTIPQASTTYSGLFLFISLLYFLAHSNSSFEAQLPTRNRISHAVKVSSYSK